MGKSPAKGCVPMKKLLILLIALFLPIYALADVPAALESSVLLNIPGEPVGILDYVQLPDGDVLLNVLTLSSLDGQSDGTCSSSSASQQTAPQCGQPATTPDTVRISSICPWTKAPRRCSCITT